MKKIKLVLFCWTVYFQMMAQPLPESVKAVFVGTTSSVDKGNILIRYFNENVDNDTLFTRLLLLKKYFQEKKDPVMVDYVQLGICRQLSRQSEFTESINELFKMLPRFEQRRDTFGMMVCNRFFSYAYYAASEKEKTLYYDQRAVDLSITLGMQYDIALAYNNIGADLAEYGHYNTASLYVHNGVMIAKAVKDPLLICKTLGSLAEYYLAKKSYDSAIMYLREAIPISKITSKTDLAFFFNDLSEIFQATKKSDSAIYYAYSAADLSAQIKLKGQLLRAYTYLSAMYKTSRRIDSAYKYLDLTITTKESIYSAEKTKHLQLISIREQNRKQELEQQKLDLQNKLKMYVLIAGLIIFSFGCFILYRNNQKEKKAKILLQTKNLLIEHTLGNLKAAQSQLIQSEKMASLGELTAGIAHEIQNPLNFVNNFSEVNKELLVEMKDEMQKGNYDEAKEIIEDVIANSEKINHHGKRADAIVKGMMQHSNSGSGKKEPTDINKLADEYLRLAYHGLRAKDKSFNATLKTDYDKSIGNINIIPQDIGRVILNLITNAFYVVDEKKKSGVENYEPIVTISTKKINGKIEIKVADNGNGIPQKILDKIFQPFFTTKPTGQGTGLGLSLSYDIMKAHGGEIKVETKEGEGSVFIIQLSN